ncbi:MMPL family transporter [Loigolactobacillus iwatensis]|uniref:MMPL family transporter n=1 Tax=Loigolactobacillus iwatensis TaxID=1267156 RepID=UPI000F7DA44C|nr:MMPL family transporter [Loigolactobacillus iwatensis]
MKRFVDRHIGALIAWIVIVIIAIVALPNTSQLVRDKGQTKIPASAQSQVANVIQNHWGRGQGNTRQVVVVFNNGNKKLTANQKDNIDQTIKNFRDNKKHYGIKAVTAASDNAEAKKQLISKDKSTELVQFMVSKKATVRNMNAKITKGAKTPGVKSYVTGSDILNDDFTQATEEGLKKTEVIAAIFIFIVLVIVFRSPVVPLISLLTVCVSFITSLSIVMNLVSRFNFPLSNFTEVFMVVVLFGIGTDYNILLFDQFKEELSRGVSNEKATMAARKVAGRTILFSGTSVLIGFTALGLAKFSIYQSAVGVAIGVAVLLAVLLTLNPFFMSVLGKRMFWPTKNFDGHSTSKLWHGLSSRSVLHPFIALGIVLVITLPFLFTYNNHLDYDNLDELSDSLPAKEGFHVVQDHFSKGTAEPSTLYIKSDKKLNNEQSLKLIDQVTKKLQKAKGVKTVASVTQPGGSAINELYVDNQVGTVTKGMKSAGKGLTKINKGLTSASDQLGSSNMSSGLSSVQQLIDGTGKLTDGSQQLASGAGQLATGANTLSGGIGQYTTGVAALGSGISQLNSSTGTLAGGVSQLTSGAYTLDGGLGQYTTGVGTLSNGLNQLSSSSGTVNSGVTQLVNQTQQLPQAVAGLTAYNNGVYSGIKDINDTLGQQQGQLQQLSTAANSLGTIKSQAATVQTELNQLKQLEGTLNQLQPMIKSMQSAQQQITALQQSANQLGSLQTQVSGQLNAVGQNDGTIASLAGSIDKTKLSSDDQAKLGQIESSAGKNVTTVQSVGKEMSTLSQLNSSLDSLSNLTKSMPDADTLNQLNNSLSGLTKMTTDAQNLLNETNKIPSAASLQGLSGQMTELTNGLGQLETAAQSSQQIANQLNNGVNGSGVNVTNANTIAATIGNSTMLSQVSQLSSGLQQYTGAVNQAATGANQLTANSAALTSGANQLAGGLGQLNGQVPQLTNGISQLNSGAQQLTGNSSTLQSGASQLASGANQLGQNAPQLTAGLIQVNNGQKTMYTTLQGLVGQMQTLHDGLVTAGNGIHTINKGVGSADSYLTGLQKSEAAKTFYIPKSALKGKTFKQSINTYMSEDNKATKFTIVLNTNPSSATSMARIDRLQTEVQNELKGTPLANAKVAIGGQTAVTSDTHKIASQDFVRTAAIMLGGILIALMFITRSVLQPFYILGTLLLAYVTSLGITRWVSRVFLGQSMLTWNTPFFSFVMLIALGVDYSIFLMMKYREFGLEGGTPSTRIVSASGIIGAVVLSAAIILSGTFAALMPSGVLTLIQVALAVIIGLVILVFMIPVVISSLIRLTYPISDKLNENEKKRK